MFFQLDTAFMCADIWCSTSKSCGCVMFVCLNCILWIVLYNGRLTNRKHKIPNEFPPFHESWARCHFSFHHYYYCVNSKNNNNTNLGHLLQALLLFIYNTRAKNFMVVTLALCCDGISQNLEYGFTFVRGFIRWSENFILILSLFFFFYFASILWFKRISRQVGSYIQETHYKLQETKLEMIKN